MSDAARATSFGQVDKASPVDKLGVWLSGYRIRRSVGPLDGKVVADIGCGFNATFVRSVLPNLQAATLVDVALADDLQSNDKVTAIEGALPEALEAIPSSTFDVVLCTSVLEHLWDPELALAQFRRLLRPGGICAINVPSWTGKRALEFSAFRLGLSPALEMNDHKAYYNPRDLWPLLVRAGFRPQDIKCFRHKFGLNTFAVCRAEIGDTST